MLTLVNGMQWLCPTKEHASCWPTYQSLWWADPSLETVLALSLWVSYILQEEPGQKQTWPSLLTTSFGAGILRPQLCMVLSCKYFNIWIQIFGIQLAKSQPCILSPRTVILGSTQLQLPKRGGGGKVKSLPMSRFTVSSKLPSALSITAWFGFFTLDSSDSAISRPLSSPCSDSSRAPCCCGTNAKGTF